MGLGLSFFSDLLSFFWTTLRSICTKVSSYAYRAMRITSYARLDCAADWACKIELCLASCCQRCIFSGHCMVTEFSSMSVFISSSSLAFYVNVSTLWKTSQGSGTTPLGFFEPFMSYPMT